MMNKTQPSKGQWLAIEERLESLYDFVKLKCDGYEVLINLARESQFKNVLSVYVDGYLKGEWFTKENDIVGRFFPVVEKSVYSRKQQAVFVKIGGKRDATRRGVFKKIKYHQICWGSFRRLKCHFIKNNVSIEWINE